MSCIDREAIEARKAEFRIDRYADPEITPAPCVSVTEFNSRFVKVNRGIKGDLSRVFAEPKRKVGRPRTREPKPQPHKGEGRSWNRRDVPDEQIIAMRNEGLSYAEIGVRIGLERSTVYRRVRAWRKA